MKNNNSKKIIIIVIAIAIILLAGIVVAITVNSSERKLAKQLAIANEYLENGDYEKAIAAFEEALDIEPMSVDAYIGGAKAYAALEDYESAIDFLQKGYDLTKDERLKDLIEEYEAIIAANNAENETPDISEVISEDEESQNDNTIDFDFYITDFTFAGFPAGPGFFENMVLTFPTSQKKVWDGEYEEYTTSDQQVTFHYMLDEKIAHEKEVYFPCGWFDCSEDDFSSYRLHADTRNADDPNSHYEEYLQYLDAPVELGASQEDVFEQIHYYEIMEKGESGFTGLDFSSSSGEFNEWTMFERQDGEVLRLEFTPVGNFGSQTIPCITLYFKNGILSEWGVETGKTYWE